MAVAVEVRSVVAVAVEARLVVAVAAVAHSVAAATTVVAVMARLAAEDELSEERRLKKF